MVIGDISGLHRPEDLCVFVYERPIFDKTLGTTRMPNGTRLLLFGVFCYL